MAIPHRKELNWIFLQGLPIMEQLQLEEALLRSDERNFAIVNFGSPRAIVMGISGEVETLIDLPQAQADRIPLIRRFSGGGTVIVDEQTLFVTFIFAKDLLPIPSFPEPILRWSADLYARSWQIPEFQLRENDYAIGEKKCGGNAQYIQKGRFLHHTSFLWDYSQKNMDYLLLPPKRPRYRQDRDHKDFLTCLKNHVSDPKYLIEKLKEELVKQFYILEFDHKSYQPSPHRQSVEKIIIK